MKFKFWFPQYDSNILLYQWIILNTLGLALVFCAWNVGWLDSILVSDITYITEGIGVLFIITMIMSAYTTWQINRERNNIKQLKLEYQTRLNEIGTSRATPGDLRDALSTYLISRLSFFSLMSNTLVTAGIIGTVIGVIIAFGDIPPDLASNLSQVGMVIANLLTGMATAFYTTLMGGICALWVKFNTHIQEVASAKLYHDIIVNEKD